jgi:hypothetical protein
MKAGEMVKVDAASATAGAGRPISGADIDEAARTVQTRMMDERVAVVNNGEK